MTEQNSARLDYQGHELELPVETAVEGNDGLDIAPLLKTTGAVTYDFDDNGNHTATSNGNAFTYNGADQTTAITTSTGTITAASYHDVNNHWATVCYVVLFCSASGYRIATSPR